MTLEEASGHAEVWPDNMPAVNVFTAAATQWRVGSAGAYGLDYGVLPDVMRMLGMPRSAWPQTFDDIRLMEDAALAEMRKE